jgi:hypothetical protein
VGGVPAAPPVQRENHELQNASMDNRSCGRSSLGLDRERALITPIGIGANRPQDAVCSTSEGPDILKKYSGANK